MLRQSLLNVSFDTMIKILPKVFYRDKHLHPQHWVTQINFHGIRLPTQGLLRSKILKLKQPDDMRYLAQKLNIDMNIKVKTTESVHQSITYSPDQIKIVNQIYKDDFQLYGYSMKTAQDGHQ